MDNSIILIGAGGHCKSCIDVIETTDFKIYGILDAGTYGENHLKYPILGDDNLIEELILKKCQFLISIGYIKSTDSRVRLYNKISQMNGQFAAVISSQAYVSKNSIIGQGTIIMH